MRLSDPTLLLHREFYLTSRIYALTYDLVFDLMVLSNNWTLSTLATFIDIMVHPKLSILSDIQATVLYRTLEIDTLTDWDYVRIN